MAQNVTIMGASYSDVPAVTLPKTGGGTARFDDASVTTATASDVAQGKIFLASDGTITTGTASGGGGGSVTQDQDGFIVLPPDGGGGGGGGSSYTLLAQKDLTISTTSTSVTLVDTITISGISSTFSSGDKIIFIKIFDKAGTRNGYYYGSLGWTSRAGAVAGTSYYVKSNGTLDYSSISYGVYATLNSTDQISIYSRYISSYGTLDGTFHVEVYELDYPNVSPFE